MRTLFTNCLIYKEPLASCVCVLLPQMSSSSWRSVSAGSWPAESVSGSCRLWPCPVVSQRGPSGKGNISNCQISTKLREFSERTSVTDPILSASQLLEGIPMIGKRRVEKLEVCFCSCTLQSLSPYTNASWQTLMASQLLV